MDTVSPKQIEWIKQIINADIALTVKSDDTAVQIGDLPMHGYEFIVSGIIRRMLNISLDELPRFVVVDLVGYAAMVAYDFFLGDECNSIAEAADSRRP